ncbi:P-loop containing nucleoside triphosphate hydrolase protein [Mycena sanguinolenta]|nr:P-loop containing nucleoside triphosphate hydrolase protein [Mycena sanguinolenta]
MTTRISWRSDLGRDTLDKIVKKVVPAWKDGLRPVQADLVAAILDGDDVLCCTATGDGKSAAFSIPILVLSEYNANSTLYPAGLRTRVGPVGVVVTPTKGLANNIVLELSKFQVSGLAYCRESLAEARRNAVNLTEEIKTCRWQVVCVDPEHLRDKEWRTISESPEFSARLLYSAVDEAHLINGWGVDFRPDFKLIGQFFRGRFPSSSSVVALSATVAPGQETASICTSLGLFDGSFHLIRRSNERPNVQFIMQTLTHGLSGYEFPDLLPFINSGRKTAIHCATIEVVHRVYAYIWSLQSANAVDRFRRVRPYHALCSSRYNEQTIHLMDNDPLCQIIVSTVAFSHGINSRKLQDTVSLGFAKTLAEQLQRNGRAVRQEGEMGRSIVLVQLSSTSAALKQLNGPGNATPSTSTRRKPTKTKTKKPSPPMETARALVLVEKKCYVGLINKLYGNPPLDITTLDCTQANRPLPCSLCLARSGKTYHHWFRGRPRLDPLLRYPLN